MAVDILDEYLQEKIELKSDEFVLKNLNNMFAFSSLHSIPNDNINTNILEQITNLKSVIKERKDKIKNHRKILKTLEIIK